MHCWGCPNCRRSNCDTETCRFCGYDPELGRVPGQPTLEEEKDEDPT